jgi:hypothetical protein
MQVNNINVKLQNVFKYEIKATTLNIDPRLFYSNPNH